MTEYTDRDNPLQGRALAFASARERRKEGRKEGGTHEEEGEWEKDRQQVGEDCKFDHVLVNLTLEDVAKT